MNTTNFKHLSDDVLLRQTRQLAARERELTVEILKHLREVEARRLFAKLGCSSLFEYAVRELSYSESSAQRRIEAMRALKLNPEIEEKIESGSLTLSVVAQAQRFFRNEAKASPTIFKQPVDRADVLKSLENKSSREAERELLALSSNPAAFVNVDRVIPKTPELSEVRFLADHKLLKDLEKLRGLLAHQAPNLTTAELIQKLTDIALEKLDPERAAVRVDRRKQKMANASQLATSQVRLRAIPKHRIGKFPAHRPSIPTETKRQVWKRDQGRCQFPGCASQHGLEIDHKIPKACGGTDEVENLRLLCRTHNQYEAERILGREYMQRQRAQ